MDLPVAGLCVKPLAEWQLKLRERGRAGERLLGMAVCFAVPKLRIMIAKIARRMFGGLDLSWG
jgi:hypothetical protein